MRPIPVALATIVGGLLGFSLPWAAPVHAMSDPAEEVSTTTAAWMLRSPPIALRHAHEYQPNRAGIRLGFPSQRRPEPEPFDRQRLNDIHVEKPPRDPWRNGDPLFVPRKQRDRLRREQALLQKAIRDAEHR